MEAVIFSKRLSGFPGIFIFLGLNISYGVSAIQHVQAKGSPQGTLWMAVGVIAFMLLGTVGWRYIVSRKSVIWLKIYFILMAVLFITTFWLENAETRDGASVLGSPVALLLLQVAVLGWRARWLMYVATTIPMNVISIFFLPVERVIPQAIPIFFAGGVIMLIGHIMVSEERAHELLDQTNHKLTEYATQVEELATVKERNRLAREIHDNLGHYLTAVNMQIEAALAVMESDRPRAKVSLTKAQTLTKEGLAEIRRSIAALRAAPTEDRPLHEAITLLVEENRAAGLDIHYQVEGSIRPCSAQVEMTLYRTAQEGLTNIRKHAQATHAELELNYRSDQRVSLKVQDNGEGKAVSKGGFGLVGIEERVKLLGGSVKVDAIQGQGFTLQVEIPL